jgi:hypothetical protein
MSKRELTERDLIRILREAGEDWQEAQVHPLTAEEKAALGDVVRRSLRMGRRQAGPSQLEQITTWLHIPAQWLSSFGVLSVPWAGAPSQAQSFAFEADDERSTRSETIPSIDSRLYGTLEVRADGRVSVDFETNHPELAGLQVAFALTGPAGAVPLAQGQLVLEPRNGRWGAAQELGTAHDLRLSEETRLVFGLQVEQ